MNILVIGGGGREHALAWKLAQSHKVQAIYVAPGNAGTAKDKRLQNLPITDIQQLCAFAVEKNIGLTVVGPEVPLAAGVVDVFRDKDLRIFGPTQAAAQLESSKAFSKSFMQRHGIPTAEFETFTHADAAHQYIDAKGAPIVVKADGLAAGKGVVVAMTLQEAHEAVDFMLVDNYQGVSHNAGGARVVVEEFLDGEEASFIVMCDGSHVLALATSQDHKRLRDGDLGPNTGGMGAYSPAPVVTPEIHARVVREVIQPVLTGMAAEGHPYSGFLYAGLMIRPDGDIKVLEFNCRLGDPETQPILVRLKSDLYALIAAAVAGRLDQVEAEWDRRTALGVVLAAAGYPEAPRQGDVISGIPAPSEAVRVFHAGTHRTTQGKPATTAGTTLQTSGGRVLCVTALGDSVKMAQRLAYQAIESIQFDGMQYRHDIGDRAVNPRAVNSRPETPRR